MDALTRGPVTAEPDPSPDASRAVHGDAVVMARQDLWWGLACATAVAGAALLLPAALALSLLQVPALFAAIWLGQAGFQLIRLRRADPDTSLTTEHERTSRERAELDEFQLRMAAATPVATYVMFGIITAVSLLAWWTGPRHAIEAAALVKPAVRDGEWWRLLTASFLHINLNHLAANMVALLILGRFVEVYDGRLRLMLVYGISVIGCSLASLLLVSATSLGASGGILGLGGYLAVVGGRRNSAPAFVRRRTAVLLALTALSGAIGYVAVDNAGHLGGAVAGALVGCVVLLVGQARADGFAAGALSLASAILLAGGAVLTSAQVLAREVPVVRGLDHVPVAVADLDAAAARYRALGFTLKPGQPHANGIRNQHAKFGDGTELELITAPEARDELTTSYRKHLANGDGPAFVAFFAPVRSESSQRIESALPHYIFFGPRNASPTDRPEYFRHANTAESLVSVWLAGSNLSAEGQLLERMGATFTQETRYVPRPAPVTVARFAEGEVLLLQTKRDHVDGRRVVGVSVRVRDLTFAERLRINGRGPIIARGGPVASVFLPPEMTHGLWLEFRQGR